MWEEEGQRECESRQRGAPRAASRFVMGPRQGPTCPLVGVPTWPVCPSGQASRRKVLPTVPWQGEGDGLSAQLPIGQRSAPRALVPQQCTQNAKSHTLSPGLSSKARSGGRSQRSLAHVWSAWLVATAKGKGPTSPGARARARPILEDGPPSRAGDNHRGHPRLVFNPVNRSPREPSTALPATRFQTSPSSKGGHLLHEASLVGKSRLHVCKDN